MRSTCWLRKMTGSTAILFAVLLVVLFAGGSYWDIFPLRGLTSENWDSLSTLDKIADYFWHLTLPLISLSLAAFATTTLLTKNSFIDEIRNLGYENVELDRLIEFRDQSLGELAQGGMNLFRRGVIGQVEGHQGGEVDTRRDHCTDACMVVARQRRAGHWWPQVWHDDGAPELARGVRDHRCQ